MHVCSVMFMWLMCRNAADRTVQICLHTLTNCACNFTHDCIHTARKCAQAVAYGMRPSSYSCLEKPCCARGHPCAVISVLPFVFQLIGCHFFCMRAIRMKGQRRDDCSLYSSLVHFCFSPFQRVFSSLCAYVVH